MFTTYYSDSLETLARIGGVVMKNMRGSSDLFVNEVIVTQNSGMFTYVKQVMTEQNGIFALTRNVRLWPFIWDLARDILPNFPEDAEHEEGFDVFSRDSLKWNLMGVLSREVSDEDLCYLRDYLKRPGITEAERTLLVYDLAAALADVYDQYQIYRPKWITQWMDDNLTEWLQGVSKSVKNFASTSDATGLLKFQWEASLWKILENNIKGVSGANFGGEPSRISRSQIITQLKERLMDPAQEEQARIREAVSKRIPGRVFFYGISSVPPEILDILIYLGRFTDVHFMFLNPCKEYWGDLRPVSRKEISERISNIMSCRIRNLHKESSLKNILAAGNQEPAGSSQTGHPLGSIVPLEQSHSWKGENSEKLFNKLYALNNGNADLETELDKLDQEIRDSGNPLLLSFGRRGRDMLALLTEKIADAQANESLNHDHQGRHLISEISAYEQEYRNGSEIPEKQNSILEYIRRDIFTLKNSASLKDSQKDRLKVATENPTLTVTSCPTRLREVQVLYDRILALFDKNTTLLPRDIIVMAPDISVYAPFIEGVFKGGNESLKARLSATEKNGELPIAICDRSMNDQNPVLSGVRTLLSISDPDAILSAHDVAALLNIEEIRRKFGLNEEDIPVIGNILSDNNAMLGLDSDDVARFRAGSGAAAGSAAASGTTPAAVPGRLQGQLEDVTIKQGINRMLLGSMMPCDGSDDKPWNADCEGDLIKALGVFAEFLAKLRDLKKALTAMSRKADRANSANPVTMNDWHAFIKNRILDVFFDLGERGTGIMNYLKRSFADAADSIDALREKPRLTLTLTLRFFDEILSGSDDGRSPFLRNAINFCTFVPMRSIPFKHVFMLGMNDGDFPVNPAVPGFDLMREKPKPGDRNRPDDDRYMFLESVLAAQESLHISYLGISPGDGSEKNPSIVVSELLDYVTDSMIPQEISEEELKAIPENERSKKMSERMRQAITRTATLNPSDARNYDKNSSFWSYQEQWFFERTGTDSAPRHSIGEGIYPAGRLEPQNGEITITASDLLKFIRDPEKYFLTRKLGMKEDYDKPAPESERFCFAFLEKGNLMQDAARLEAADPDDEKRQSFRDLLIRKGGFPAGNVGEYAWKNFNDTISALDEALSSAEIISDEDALSLRDEIVIPGIPDYSAVCIKLNEKLPGRPFVLSDALSEEQEAAGVIDNSIPWEISDLIGSSAGRDLKEAYWREFDREPETVTVRITKISEVKELLYRNVMFDPWHAKPKKTPKSSKDFSTFNALMNVNALLYACCAANATTMPAFYAIDKACEMVPAPDFMSDAARETAAKMIADTLTLYLLGQIVPLRFDSGSSYNSESDANGTRRDFSDPGKILFDAGSGDDVRNFTETCEAFVKAIIGGNSDA